MKKERTAVRKFGFLFLMVLLLLSMTVSSVFSAYIQVTAMTDAGTSISGSRIYVFNHAGSYLGLYQLSDAEGHANFDLDTSSGTGYLFRLDYKGRQFWSKTFFDTPVEPVSLVVDEENISVSVRDLVDGLPGIRVYLFTETGNYLGAFGETGDDGRVTFFVPVGMRVKFRADYLGYQFWSEITPVEEGAGSTLLIPHQSVIVSVNGGAGSAEQIQNARVYLFSPSDSYLGIYQMAEDNGQVSFMLPETAYKARVDYLGQQYWSGVFTWEDTVVTIPFGDAEVIVKGNGQAIENIPVYAFSDSGAYLGVSGQTGENGRIVFHLPSAPYRFRADYQGSQYWSEDIAITPDNSTIVPISSGGGTFNLAVLKSDGVPLSNVPCYVFNDQGTYLGISGRTDGDGQAALSLADGIYKIRVDYLGYQFWSSTYSVPEKLSDSFVIPHRKVDVLVEKGSDGGEAIPGAVVYLFSQSGAYLGQRRTGDDEGKVCFMLPETAYKVRVDYLGQQYWSGVFTWEDTAVAIPFGDAEVIVTGNGQAIKNIPVYAFSESGAYLGVSGKTGENGRIVFQLPSASHRFRADYQGSQYWSEDIAITSDNNTLVPISSGGGTFNLAVLKSDGVPLSDVSCYVFNDQGAYLGISSRTDGDGQAAFSLADGIYKIRVDYLGHRFWSNTYSVPEKLSEMFVIPHQDAVVTVVGLFQTEEPIPAARVYLFSESGAYMGQSQISDTEGQVLFSLPDREYKVRADYLGYQFWSDKINGHENKSTVRQGIAEVHATRNGTNLSGARIYLFSRAGAYLGRHDLTDGDGKAHFLLPDRAYKFRVDEGGDQVWSDTVQIVPGATNNLHVELSPLTVSISADLLAVQFGGSVFLTWHSAGADSCAITPAVGSVSLSGSYELNPTSTTTYMITATGPAGSVTSTVTVAVSYSPETDTDGDGMPDGWEASHGLDPLANNAHVDSDGDGLNNLFEYQNGSLPDDGGSVPNDGNYYQYNSSGRIKHVKKIR